MIPSVALPGQRGPAGTSGNAAFTTTLANYTQPAVNSSVTINVGTTAYMSPGMSVWTPGGVYMVAPSGVVDATHVTVINYYFLGNLAQGSTILSGSSVTPSGGLLSRDVAPDANDVYAWDLGESAAPYANQGSAGSANLTVLGSGTLRTSPSLFGVGPNSSNSVGSAGTGMLTGGAGSAGVAYPISMSCWFFQTVNPGGSVAIFGRGHDTGTDSTGNESVCLFTNSGTLQTMVYTATGEHNLTATYPTLVTNTWHHVGFTYDGATLIQYVDGDAVKSTSVTGAVQWTTANPWCVYGIADTSDTTSPYWSSILAGRVQRVRVASVARPASWWLNVWQSGMGRY